MKIQFYKLKKNDLFKLSKYILIKKYSYNMLFAFITPKTFLTVLIINNYIIKYIFKVLKFKIKTWFILN
jgi:hypothetical protein